MTNTKCQACAADSTLFLCGRCVTLLRDELRDLPWWLERLQEAELRQTRMGTGGGARRTKRSGDIHGDDKVFTECICSHGVMDHDTTAKCGVENCGCMDYVPNVEKLRTKVLGAAINPRASDLMAAIGNSLGTTVRDLCETRGVEYV